MRLSLEMLKILADLETEVKILGTQTILKDDLTVDRKLGEIEHLVYRARQNISDEWSAARRISDRPPARSPSFNDLTLDDLA